MQTIFRFPWFKMFYFPYLFTNVAGPELCQICIIPSPSKYCTYLSRWHPPAHYLHPSNTVWASDICNYAHCSSRLCLYHDIKCYINVLDNSNHIMVYISSLRFLQEKSTNHCMNEISSKYLKDMIKMADCSYNLICIIFLVTTAIWFKIKYQLIDIR